MYIEQHKHIHRSHDQNYVQYLSTTTLLSGVSRTLPKNSTNLMQSKVFGAWNLSFALDEKPRNDCSRFYMSILTNLPITLL